MKFPNSLRALRSPRFRRYYIGQAISMIGTWIQSVAFMWLAYRISGSTWFTGLIGTRPVGAIPAALPVAAVTASAENPPNETKDKLTDELPGTKWLTFATTGWVV